MSRLPMLELTDCDSRGAGSGTLELEPGVWMFKTVTAESHIQKVSEGAAITEDDDGDLRGWRIDVGDEPVQVFVKERDTLAYTVAATGKMYFARIQILE